MQVDEASSLYAHGNIVETWVVPTLSYCWQAVGFYVLSDEDIHYILSFVLNVFVQSVSLWLYDVIFFGKLH